MPVVVLVMMSSEVRNGQSEERTNLWQDNGNNTKVLRQNRLVVGIAYLFCIVATWVIWSIGIRDQQYPTRIVFGGALNLRVSDFLYKHANSYILSVCILITVLPIAGLIAFTTLRAWYNYHKNKNSLEQSLEILKDTCRSLYILFDIAQFSMFIYIRGQAISQANGTTSETDWGFGQILVIFTWLPLVLTIGSKIITERAK